MAVAVHPPRRCSPCATVIARLAEPTMPLHVETLLFAGIAIRAAFVVIFIANTQKRRKQVYLLKWFASPAFALVALIGVALAPDVMQRPAVEGAAIAALIGVSFSLRSSGLHDLLGRKSSFVAILAFGLIPGAVYMIAHALGEPRWALAGALISLAALAARPIVNLLPAYWRKRQPSQFFVLAALAFYATAFGATGLRVALGGTEGLGPIAAIALAADCFFSVLLLVNFLAITGEQARRSLRDLATTDTLTTLLNRRGFLDVVNKALAHRIGDETVGCVIMADIDHFKAINDRFGHDGGDVVLGEFARRCRSVVRQPGDLVARWGGEEFVVFLPDATLADARAFAEQMRQAVAAKPFKVSESLSRITMSAGVAELKLGEVTIDAAIERADVALYRAKDKGRDQICLWRDRKEVQTIAGASFPLAPVQMTSEISDNVEA